MIHFRHWQPLWGADLTAWDGPVFAYVGFNSWCFPFWQETKLPADSWVRNSGGRCHWFLVLFLKAKHRNQRTTAASLWKLLSLPWFTHLALVYMRDSRWVWDVWNWNQCWIPDKAASANPHPPLIKMHTCRVRMREKMQSLLCFRSLLYKGGSWKRRDDV